jgi:Ca2+-binding RTX toxin-like protein
MVAFSGSSADDIFTGSLDNDQALGGAGNDKLSGADGSDTLTGNSGADTLDGGAGDDLLYSGDASPAFNLPYPSNPYVLPQADTGSERDSLIGGDGSDRIFAGYGDHVDGGPGGSYGDYLYISFMGAPSGVTADFGLASQTIGGALITSIENISYVQGSQFADNLNARSTGTGYSDFNAVSGMGGNDTLTAGYYTGSLFGDEGDDFVDGRPSQYLFLVEGGAGNDTLYSSSGPTAVVNGGAGADTIYASGQVRGGAGDDLITMQFTYYTGSTVYGDEGDDRITAASSGNKLVGGAGGDVLSGAEGADALYAGDALGNGLGPADDNGLDRDRLSGAGGDDTLAAGFGDDVDGGSGSDVLYLSLGGASQGANIDLSALGSGGSVTVGGGTIRDVERLVYLRGSDAADSIRLPTQGVMMTVDAGGGDDVITTQGSSASVLGGAGADRLVSGPAADTFDGGLGIDTIDYSGSASGVVASLRGSGGSDTLFSVEVGIGSAFNDTLVGAGNGSSLSGGAGDDRIEIGARDLATLGSGADLVYLAAGSFSAGSQSAVATVTDWTAADKLQFGAATGAYAETTASDFSGALQAALVQAAAGYNFVSVQVASDVYVFGVPVSGRQQFDAAVRLVGVSLDQVSASNVGLPGPLETPQQPSQPNPPAGGGSSGGQSLAGTAGNDNLSGGSGADTLSGADGSDSLQGFGGDDRLDGGGGVDEAVYLNASAGVTVNLATAGPQNTGDGIDTLVSIESLSGSQYADNLTGDGQANLLRGWLGGDTLSGGGGADTLDGREGADLLNGGDGDDHLMGHMAADTMSGGAGADVFEFNLTGDAVAASALGGNLGVLDRILDWSSEDFLQFWGAPGANLGNYREITAGSYDTAYSQAQGAYSEFGVAYTAAQVGGDVVVFAPQYNQAVVLAGRTLSDISPANVGPTPSASPPQPPPSSGGANTPTAGNDVLSATAASPTMMGGLGNDTITGGSAPDYLRGDEGNDKIVGGSAFDDINGNMGDDTASGGVGDDWVVGGKDNDSLSGDEGSDIVYGNLGTDTCDGGEGADIVRGGQDADLVRGGAGDDYVSGDRGDDTVVGGSGADLFHTFADSGLDRVLDFSIAEGDRVLLDPGTQYTVSQSGADTVITMSGGQMILVGVQMSSLTTGWIFGA